MLTYQQIIDNSDRKQGTLTTTRSNSIQMRTKYFILPVPCAVPNKLAVLTDRTCLPQTRKLTSTHQLYFALTRL
jgi:hypothetical protein